MRGPSQHVGEQAHGVGVGCSNQAHLGSTLQEANSSRGVLLPSLLGTSVTLKELKQGWEKERRVVMTYALETMKNFRDSECPAGP